MPPLPPSVPHLANLAQAADVLEQLEEPHDPEGAQHTQGAHRVQRVHPLQGHADLDPGGDDHEHVKDVEGVLTVGGGGGGGKVSGLGGARLSAGPRGPPGAVTTMRT